MNDIEVNSDDVLMDLGDAKVETKDPPGVNEDSPGISGQGVELY
jgi:hypothetical protein